MRSRASWRCSQAEGRTRIVRQLHRRGLDERPHGRQRPQQRLRVVRLALRGRRLAQLQRPLAAVGACPAPARPALAQGSGGAALWQCQAGPSCASRLHGE